MGTSFRNVISFSLYGAHRLYCEGALRNVELARILYPDWTCRFYLDGTVPQAYRTELIERGAQIVLVSTSTPGSMYGRYWRFWVAADACVARYLIRDTDSRLNPREKAAVDEWISSGKSFHIMRDSAHHRTRALAGMWGGIGGKLPTITKLIDDWGQYDQPGKNDQFVSEILFPLMQDDYICHDGAGYFDDGRPFPTHPPLSGTRFVGEIVDDDQLPTDIWRQSAEFENRLIFEIDRRKTLLGKIDALQNRVTAYETARISQAICIGMLRERLKESEDRRASQLTHIDVLAGRLESATAEIAWHSGQVAALTGQLEAELRRTSASEREVMALTHSRSWRMTKPLRVAKVKIARLRSVLFESALELYRLLRDR